MGWDIDRFPEPDKDLVCCICTGILDDPVETRCRHVYCRECLETWNRTRPVCPTCREVVHPRDVRAVNPVLKNIIGKQMINCNYKTNGCEEKTTIDLLGSHLEGCKYKLEECTNHGCTVQTLRGEAVEHARVCPKRLVSCQRGCDLVMTQDDSEDHNCLSALRTHFTGKVALCFFETFGILLTYMIKPSLSFLRVEASSEKPKCMYVTAISAFQIYGPYLCDNPCTSALLPLAKIAPQ